MSGCGNENGGCPRASDIATHGAQIAGLQGFVIDSTKRMDNHADRVRNLELDMKGLPEKVQRNEDAISAINKSIAWWGGAGAVIGVLAAQGIAAVFRWLAAGGA